MILNTPPALLVLWFALSVSISLWRLPCYIREMPPSSQSELPVHEPESLVHENIGQSIILVVFFHMWSTMIYLFTVVTGNFASNNGLSGTLPSCVIAFVTLFLVVGFAHYLEALSIPRKRWGHFKILYLIVTFPFYLVYPILWIIDLFRGRIEFFRRREVDE
ncbi:hypothetical protein GYMLUDRAFT_245159 [Collybiopsis luxurians FD-317 M1]|uniref:Uncharacterized protein n=1 Tax=Collybiopsis luxurians FD-317 M1 TaxID=944289 RepID=A0A0D0CUI6_9AGAR|nr:hypothetical protein GYMLUDRAFT_245159 [Collybiopsis luxurians FD-317 M1]